MMTDDDRVERFARTLHRDKIRRFFVAATPLIAIGVFAIVYAQSSVDKAVIQAQRGIAFRFMVVGYASLVIGIILAAIGVLVACKRR
jgi:hypothetical protein